MTTAANQFASFSLDDLRAAYAKAQRAAANHTSRGLLHFAKLCSDRAAELAGEILVRSDTI